MSKIIYYYRSFCFASLIFPIYIIGRYDTKNEQISHKITGA